MSTPSPPSASPLDNVVIVLDEPQNVVNIAGVIRGMMNMGLSHLRLVRPAEFDPYRIEGIAHRSAPLIEATRVFDTLDEAVADAELVVATTARPRTAGHNYTRPRTVAPLIVERAREGTVAILFGREDKGLSNQALDRAHQAVIIPTSGDYWSLNLAQAFLLVAYEVFLAAGEGEKALPRGRRATRAATHGELAEMFGALELGLGRIDFFKARSPEAVMRTLRKVLARADLDRRESRLIGAIGFETNHYIDRLARVERAGEGGADGPARAPDAPVDEPPASPESPKEDPPR